MSEDFYFDDGGDAYVKGEKNLPVNWDDVTRLQELIDEINEMSDEAERLSWSKVLVAAMYGD